MLPHVFNLVNPMNRRRCRLCWIVVLRTSDGAFFVLNACSHIFSAKSHQNFSSTVVDTKIATNGSKLHDKGPFFLGPLHQFAEQQNVYFLQLSLVTSLWTDPTSIPARPCTIVFINLHSCNAGGHGIKPICQIIWSSGWFESSSYLSLWTPHIFLQASICYRVQAK